MILILMMSLGCGPTSPETLIDELRVMASVAEPPEVKPNTPFSYKTYFANPDAEDVVAMTWVCTNLGDGCLEALGGVQSIHHTDLEGTAPTWEHTLSVSPALLEALDEDTALTATQIWTLACVRDTCPIIDEVASIDSEEPWPTEIGEKLANPLSWMSKLPMEGTSLAYQLLTTSLSDDPHQNPTIELTEDLESLKRGKYFYLNFFVNGQFSSQAQLYSYIVGGGFGAKSAFVTAGEQFELQGTAPKDGDETRIWSVLVDGKGGVAVWTEQLPLD